MCAFAVGDVVDERYRIVAEVGHGGHGYVYAAEDESVGSRVALKFLSTDLASDPEFKVRMHREARAMGALSGTSATQIFAFNKASDGSLYIVMELLQGRDLDQYLRDIDTHGGQIELKRLVDLLAPIAETLDAAHALGIIHRDVKPANIFVLDNLVRGGVRLLDFGLAKHIHSAALTKDGFVAGSPAYIAPEVWRGRGKTIDQRIDVYALGAVAYRALTGSPPFNPKEAIDQFLIAVTRGRRPRVRDARPDLPSAADGWMEKVLAADPDQRFASTGEAWKALRALAEMPARDAPYSERTQPWEVEIDIEIDEEVTTLREGRGAQLRKR